MPQSIQELEAIIHSAAPSAERAAAFNLLSERVTGIDSQRALRYAEEALRLGEELPDQGHYLTARLNRAWIRHETGDYALSAREAAEVIKLARQLQLSEQAYDALNILGNNHNRIGNRPEALDAFLQALTVAQTLNNAIKVAAIENNIGLVYEGMKDFQQALAYYHKALETYQSTSANAFLQNVAGTNVAESLNALGQYADALPVAQEAYRVAAEPGYKLGMGKAQLQIAVAHVGLGEPERATGSFAQALDYIHEADSPYHESLVLKHIAAECIRQGQLAEGIEQLDKALALVEPLQTLPAIFALHEALAQAYEQTGDFRKAYRHLKRFQQIKERVFNEQADSREKMLHALFELDRARLETESQRHRNAALQHQLEQYESMIAELDGYAANVAHDLKNPIGIIMGYVTLLEMELEGQMSEVTQEGLRIISETTDKMQTIVESLLSLAQARKAEIMPQPVDMDAVVRNALLRLEAEMLAKGATVEVNTPLPPALAHPEWLEEAWVNYIGNAIKYGGDQPHVQIDWIPETNGMIRYRVADRGRGIAPEDISRLFTRFERLGEHKIDGSGIGLTIVKTIIEKLGGQVAVESEGVSGKGSIFSFALPPAG